MNAQIRTSVTLRPDIAAAIATAKENLPPYPTALCEELGAFIAEQNTQKWWKQGKPYFSGWIWMVAGYPCGIFPNNVCMSLEEGDMPGGDFDISDIGYHGFWQGRVKDGSAIWCTVPSLDYGESEPGALMTIGDKKIRLGYTQAELDATLRAGWQIMRSMIEERGELTQNGAIQ